MISLAIHLRIVNIDMPSVVSGLSVLPNIAYPLAPWEFRWCLVVLLG